MLKESIRNALRSMGYEVRRIRLDQGQPRRAPVAGPAPPSVAPVWPLPRRPGGPSDQWIRDQFARFPLWHYGYEFEGGLSFQVSHNSPDELSDNPRRPLRRFRHFMPYLVEAMGGSLRGKRVLDIACNSGFWSLQCGLLGAEVVGFDARPELIEQADLIKSIVGLDNVDFQVLDINEMRRETLGDFDAILNLGILYHLPDPLGTLAATKAMAKGAILLDTSMWRSDQPIVHYSWEEPVDIRSAAGSGIVAYPSKGAIELMLKHLGVREFREIPLSTDDMPADYLDGGRASWLIKV